MAVKLDYGTASQRKLLQEGARDFLRKEIAPLVEECERKYHPLPKDMLQGFFKQLIPLGYVSSIAPAEYGGEDLDFVSCGVLLEELAHVWPSLAVSMMVQSGQARFVALHGTDEHRRKYLPGLLSADIIASLGGTEPNAGSGLRDLQTTAVLKGSGYLVNGTKLWITNGTICDICVVLAYTDKSKKTHGMTLLLVDRNESPFTSTNIEKLGLHCSSTAELVFEDCRVPADNVTGEVGSGYQLISSLLALARCCTSIVEVGISQAAVDQAVKYARERVQFGRPIAKFQLIQELIADMVVETEAARLLTYKALRLAKRTGQHFLESSAAKYYACETAGRVTARAIEVHGAYGISQECPTERLYRDARTLFAPDGPMPIQKLFIG
ncbi:MAG: hypothetical protein FJZ95_09805, partial [Chloroflexi bacterium]|nr:hypothetical protein [Chloroflexota bacterium]